MINETISLVAEQRQNICETCNYVLMKPDSSRCTTAAHVAFIGRIGRD